MAKGARIFCLGEEFVYLEGKEITPIKVDKEKLETEIEKTIQIHRDKKPREIFVIAVENVTGIKFKNTTTHLKTKNGEFSLFDSPLFVSYHVKICANPIMKESFEKKCREYRDMEKFWKSDKELRMHKKNIMYNEALRKKRKGKFN